MVGKAANAWSGPVLARGQGGSKGKDKKKQHKADAVTVEAFLAKHTEALAPLATFFVADWAQFPSLMAVDQSVMEGRDKKVDLDARAKAVQTVLGLEVAYNNGNQVSRDTIRNGGDAVLRARGGECSTFGLAAAHLLLMQDSPHTIEVVAYKGSRRAFPHVFVLVGRPAFTSLHDYDSWKSIAWVVDMWSGALGHAAILPATQFTVSPLNDGKLKTIYTSFMSDL